MKIAPVPSLPKRPVRTLSAQRCGFALRNSVAQGRPHEVLQSALLAEIYGEPNVRAQRIGDQTLVWIDA
jgi:hypothetical protein